MCDGSETDGLKMNILYQSAGPDFINQGPNAEYAEVSKPAIKTSKSSEVQKQNDVYAEVDKKAQQKNVKKKKQKGNMFLSCLNKFKKRNNQTYCFW